MTGSFIDAAIYFFIAYCFFVGLRKGLLNILVDIFGIYGACFIAWAFHGTSLSFFGDYFDVSADIARTLIFLGVWLTAYLLINVIGMLVTGIFKFTGINFVLRISGSILNGVKGIIIVTIVLTFIQSLNRNLYEPTKATAFFTGIGVKAMHLYNDKVDEDSFQSINNQFPITKEDVLLDDDFEYNLLER